MSLLGRRKETPPPVDVPAGAAAGDTSFVVFEVDGTHYAMPVSRVRRTLQFPAVTRLPAVAQDVLGVFQNGGRLITLFDLRVRFAAGNDPPAHPWVLVVEHDHAVRALAVDAVLDVLTLPGATVQPTPAGHDVPPRAQLRGLLRAGPPPPERPAKRKGATDRSGPRPMDPEEAEHRTLLASRAGFAALDPIHLLDVDAFFAAEDTP